jgi:hypothetical protein
MLIYLVFELIRGIFVKHVVNGCFFVLPCLVVVLDFHLTSSKDRESVIFRFTVEAYLNLVLDMLLEKCNVLEFTQLLFYSFPGGMDITVCLLVQFLSFGF